MAKATLVISDDDGQLTCDITFDPPIGKPIPATVPLAQSVGLEALTMLVEWSARERPELGFRMPQ